MNFLALDIETLALPESVIRANILPFDPDKVPLGNAYKPDTVARIIEDARKVHGDDIVAKAAIYPEYGQVAIVGVTMDAGVHQWHLSDDTMCQRDEEREFAMLARTWNYLYESLSQSATITGWNIKGFDLPFLVKRSWMLGVKVPSRIYNPFKPKYPWSECIVDLQEVFMCGQFKDKFTSQNAACRALGIEVNEGNGAEFGELWKRDKQAALAYNADDLRCVSQLAERLIG